MRIVMFSNTYLPHVGGVARSVSAFERCYRNAGHAVMIVAPEFEAGARSELSSKKNLRLIQALPEELARVPKSPGSLSEALDAPLVTADGRLLARVAGTPFASTRYPTSS